MFVLICVVPNYKIISVPFARLCGNMWPLLAKDKIWQDPEKAITSSGIWNNK